MKKTMRICCLMFTSLLAWAQQPSSEEGQNREWLTSFTAVEVTAPLDIKFVRVPDTEAPRILYDTKGSTTSRFRAEVRNKVLYISERYDSRRIERTSVTVYYNTLERLAIADAVATFEEGISATLLDMTVGGTARVTASLDVKDLKMEQTGKSSVTLSGDVRYLSLYVSNGTFTATELEVMAAEVNVTGSGSASLWVTDRFEGKTSTGGKIVYKGDPTVVRRDLKFMGGDILHTEE